MTDATALGLSISVRQSGPIPLDASITVAPGELLALVGPSGAGKTTLLRAAAGLYRPRDGVIACAGETWFDSAANVFTPPHLRAAGLVFQSYALFPHMTALANIMAAMGARDPADQRRRALDLMERLHLSGLEDRKPAQLSGGQQQRVAVARALARDPKVLLLDEPFSAVDKATRGRLYSELADLRRGLDLPILLVTHDVDEAARLAGRMALLDGGRVIQTGAPLDVLARPASVAAARLADIRNLFEGCIEAHDADATRIRWEGGSLLVRPARRDLPPGASIAWSAPTTQVILHRGDTGGDMSADGALNVIDGVILDVVMLSEAASIVAGAGPDRTQRFTMTTPAHFVQRTGMAPGDAIRMAIAPESIHLISA